MNDPVGEISLRAAHAKLTPPAPAPLREDAAFAPRSTSSPPPAGTPMDHTNRQAAARLFCDPWRILAALKQRSQVIIGTAGVAALGAGIFGYLQSNYHVRVSLIALETNPTAAPSLASEGYHPRQLTTPTLVTLMQSPDLLRRGATGVQSSDNAGSLQGRVSVEQVPGTELVALTVTGKTRQSLVDLANLLANQAVALGRELQVAEAEQMSRFSRDKLAALDEQVQRVNAELIQFQNTEKLADPDAEKQGYIQQMGDVLARADNARISVELLDLQVVTLQNELAQQSPIAQKLEAARSKLTDLMGHYTELHPRVRDQRGVIAELEKQLPAAGNGTLAAAKYSENPQVSAMYHRIVDLQTRKATAQKELSELTKLHDSLLGKVTGLSEKSLRFATIKAQFDGLQKNRGLLANRQREAQLHQENSQGYYRVVTPATLQDVDSYSRWLAALIMGSVGLLLGGLGAGLVIAGREIADRRLKTVLDVQRATGLPVLAALGDLNQMSQAEKDAWAFRTWTAISGQLNASPNHGIVCGFISSGAGEGRSTWIELLVGAGKQRGLQVMTIATRPGEDALPAMDRPANVVEPDFFQTGGPAGASNGDSSTDQTRSSFSPSLAVAPTAALNAHIPLPGKVWDLARRKEWQNTLAQMRQTDSLVLFVELPPASVPEAVLLAESLPQVIWLADSGRANRRDTREQLQTLRHARCRLVGAVLNHEPKPIFEL
ncbi:MAG: hypothetical protein V9H26_26225 [Verrucomicrobiota bacterium]